MRRLLTVILSLCLILLSMAVLTPAIQSQGSTDSQNLLANRVSGPSVGEFLTADGRFDLEAARASGYQGPVDLSGFDVRIDAAGGNPFVSPELPLSKGRYADDTYWDNSLSPSAAGVGQIVRAAIVRDGRLIVGGDFNAVLEWDGTSWAPLGSGINGDVLALTEYDGKLIAGGRFTWVEGIEVNRVASWDGGSWSPL